MATQTWLGRFTIGSSTDTIDLDDNAASTPTVSLTAGDYYLAGYTSETTDQLIEHINTQVQAEGGDFADLTFSFSYTTGKVSVVAGAGDDIDITWTDTALRDLLGFTANLTGVDDTAQVATNEAQYIWRPDRPPSSHPVDLTQFWELESNTIVHRSRDGTTYTVAGNALYRAQIEYVCLGNARVITPSTGTVNQDLQSFFADVAHAGQPMRVFMDDTAITSADYETAIWGDGQGDLGAFTNYAQRHIGNYQSLWDVSIPLIKYVS